MHIKAKIFSNIKIGPGCYKMILSIGSVSKVIKPGQFFNVKCNDGLIPLLRRPFSVHRIRNTKHVEILYEVVGSATEALSRKKKDEFLDIIGPLGNGFSLQTTNYKLQTTVLVAGGMGIAPLLALAEEISRVKRQGSRVIVIGAKTKEAILCERDFEKLDFEIMVATEDGSKGKKALATDLLKDLLLRTVDRRPWTIYTCGPNPMLKKIAKMAKSKRIRAYGSFEEHMACGVGSCYGCVIETKKGYKRICKDGPVFELGEIVWRK